MRTIKVTLLETLHRTLMRSSPPVSNQLLSSHGTIRQKNLLPNSAGTISGT